MKSIYLTGVTALFLIFGGATFISAEEAGHKSHSGHEGHKNHDKHADHAEHKEPKKHKGHKEHKGHDGHGHEAHVDKVKLSNAQIKELGIEISQGVFGKLSKKLVRPAVVKFDQERVAHIVPRVSGVVRNVFASEGDEVNAGDVIAILESRELAKATAEYIARHKRMKLLGDMMSRENDLKRRGISRVRDFLEVRMRHGEAEIDLQKAKHNLLALGIDDRRIKKITGSDPGSINQFNITAPLSGVITDRHVVRGEFVSSSRQLFVIANMKTVWVDITVYPRDLGRIKRDQKISINTGSGENIIYSRISFVSSGLKSDTRTAIARAIVPNSAGHLNPGMFVQTEILSGTGAKSLSIPESALQTHEGKTVVFVAHGNEFSARPIVIGERHGGRASIRSGLKAGEKFVSKGSFTIRAQLAKASFGDGHNH